MVASTSAGLCFSKLFYN